jgi:hypothetical protein
VADKEKPLAVARGHQILYLYAFFNVILTVIDVFLGWHQVHKITSSSSQLSLKTQIEIEKYSLVFGAVFNVLLFTYLVLSTKQRRVRIILKVLLVLELAGCLILLISPSIGLLIGLCEALATYIVLREVDGKQPLIFF